MVTRTDSGKRSPAALRYLSNIFLPRQGLFLSREKSTWDSAPFVEDPWSASLKWIRTLLRAVCTLLTHCCRLCSLRYLHCSSFQHQDQAAKELCEPSTTIALSSRCASFARAWRPVSETRTTTLTDLALCPRAHLAFKELLCPPSCNALIASATDIMFTSRELLFLQIWSLAACAIL